ncbi:MAG: carbohydrate kinase family protein [Thermoplasmata archaeon]|nr:carbohydrate kinase family protein [Thermoplasmata archaeon]
MKNQNYLGVLGHVAIDTICLVRRFPSPNTCEAVIDRRVEFGGTGANLAVYAASLGIKTALCSFVGEDFPEDYMQWLKSKKIDLSDLVVIKNGRTPSIIMVSDDSHQQIGYVDQGAMVEQDKMPLPEHTIMSSEVLHIGTGRPGYALQVCRQAKARGKKIGFDPAQEIHYVYSAKQFSDVFSMTDMFFCNESELKVALSYLDLKKSADLLEHVEMLIMTLGKLGSRIMTKRGESIDIPPCKPKKVVDTTGAGDAYRAGFYAGLSRGLDLEKCGALASSAASFAVESFGGQTNPPSWDDVKERAFHDSSA